MRARTLMLAVFCAALLGATTTPAGGQEEPLPPVKPKPAEPVAAETDAPQSLADAAARHDYVAFSALYNDLKRRGQSVEAYSALYDLWNWSLSHPDAVSYGVDLYERFARDDPGFAKSIAPYASVDSDGNTVWPVSETRAVLLDRALAAEARASDPETVSDDESSAVNAPALPRVTPVARTTQPARDLPPAAQLAPPMTQPPIAAVETTTTAAPQRARVAATPQQNPWRYGILLLVVLAVFGVGVFARLTRSPKEDLPIATIEPIRRLSGPIDVRASGSPGSDEPQPHSPSSPDRSHRDEDARGLRR